MVRPVGRRKQFPWKFLVLGLVAGAAIYWGTSYFRHGGSSAPQGMPGDGMPASVAYVVSKSITPWREFSGRIEAVSSANIRPRVGGQITGIHFRDGAEVKKGQLLFTIDPRPYEAAYISAKAAYTQTQANFARLSKLIKSKAISRAEYETAQSGNQQALGNYKLAEVNLAYTKIVAPISGKISRAELTEGNLVEAGPNAPLMASIVKLSPIYASFELDERTFLSTIQGVPSAKLKQIPVEVGVSSDSGTPLKATIHSFDNQIAPGSGTIRVRALIENKESTLVPGLFARVRIGAPEQLSAILIHPASVSTDQDKKFVYVVGGDGKVEYRVVTLGGISDGLQIVTSGLKEGEQIVVSGLQRIRPGITVKPVPADMQTLKPLNEPSGDAAPSEAPKP